MNYLLETVQAGEPAMKRNRKGEKIKYSCLAKKIIIEMTK